MVWFKVITDVVGGLFGLGKTALDNRAKSKQLLAEQKHEIIAAETHAIVDRITNNTLADNEIDIITARNKKYTWKDEVVTYLFLIPVFIASATPFIIAYQNGDWINMNTFVQESYKSLDLLPDWYKWVVGLIVIDVLGFRSFTRKVIDKWSNKKLINK